MSLLDNLKDVFSGIGESKSDTYAGIDIGSSYVKVVQLKKDHGHIILETYGEVALGPYEKTKEGEDEHVSGELTHLEPEALAEALKNIIEQANITAKNVVFSIPSSGSLIFILKLPKIEERKLGGAIETEARRYIPVPLTEVTLDWWIIPEKEVYGEEDEERSFSDITKSSDEVEVLVAAVRNEVVEEYTNISTMLKMFKQPSFEIETFSAIRASLQHELAPVMLIDFGASGTRIVVVEHGVVRKFHAVNRGSAYLTESLKRSLQISFKDAEKMKREVGLDSGAQNEEAYNIISAGVNYIFSEIKNVLFDFEKEYHKPVSKIILTGGGSLLKQLREQIEGRYNIRTIYADPFEKVVAPDFLDEVLDTAGPEFAVALGLALQELL